MQTKNTWITSLAKVASVCRHAEHTKRMKAVPVFQEGEVDKTAVEMNEQFTKIKWNIS